MGEQAAGCCCCRWVTEHRDLEELGEKSMSYSQSPTRSVRRTGPRVINGLTTWFAVLMNHLDYLFLTNPHTLGKAPFKEKVVESFKKNMEELFGLQSYRPH